MKIDYDLAREMMLLAEKETDGVTPFGVELFLDHFPNKQEKIIKYHYKYLKDIGCLEMAYIKNIPIDLDIFCDITPEGRDFLSATKNKEIWDETKEKIQPYGDIVLSLVKEVALSLIKEKLGL